MRARAAGKKTQLYNKYNFWLTRSHVTRTSELKKLSRNSNFITPHSLHHLHVNPLSAKCLFPFFFVLFLLINGLVINGLQSLASPCKSPSKKYPLKHMRFWVNVGSGMNITWQMSSSYSGRERLGVNLVGVSHYKWFFGPSSSTEASRLASLNRCAGKRNPLKENRGKRWFHADWDA